MRTARAAAGVVAVGGITLALSAFGPGYLDRVWSSAQADQRFVAAVRAEGRPVQSGEDEKLVVEAAQKLCERRDTGVNSAQRRASTLTPEEIAAVRRAFGDDSEAFIKMATRAYCP